MGKDPSVGEPTKLFGMSTKERNFSSTLTPDGLRKKDVDGLIESALDVTALPGMCLFCIDNAESFDASQGMSEMTTQSLAVALGRKAQLHDVQWKQLSLIHI